VENFVQCCLETAVEKNGGKMLDTWVSLDLFVCIVVISLSC
jgi:hypothetical protein